MATDNKDFFKQQTDSSRVKATIISEYFPSYCKIICKRHVPRKFGYYDMFAGPGMYEDGCLSTPLLVASKCYKDAFLRGSSRTNTTGRISSRKSLDGLQ